MRKKVILDVLFCSASGKSLLERTQELAEEDLSQYAATKETAEQAVEALRRLGFDIVGPAGPFGVSITGSWELVHEIFGDELTIPASLMDFVSAIRVPPPVEFYGPESS